jgi:hypothetical protein
MPADAALVVAVGAVLLRPICVVIAAVLCRMALRSSASFEAEVETALFRFRLQSSQGQSKLTSPDEQNGGNEAPAETRAYPS